MSDWVLARQKKSAAAPWTSTISIEIDDFLEVDFGVEEDNHRDAVLACGKVLTVSPPNENGVMVEVSFIGSDDPATAAQMRDSSVNLHLCRLKPRQLGCKVTTAGMLHVEKFRKLTVNDVRALSYGTREALGAFAPPPALNEAGSCNFCAEPPQKGGPEGRQP